MEWSSPLVSLTETLFSNLLPPTDPLGLSQVTNLIKENILIKTNKLEERRARELRRDFNLSFGDVAIRMGKPKEAVCRALMKLRTPSPRRTRASLNVELEDAEFIKAYCWNGESVREGFSRFLREHR